MAYCRGRGDVAVPFRHASLEDDLLSRADLAGNGFPAHAEIGV